MKLVIDISEDDYRKAQDGRSSVSIMRKVIINGTPLTEKTGRWIFDEKIDKHYYCSECKAMGADYFDYCPYCGARMREVVDESVDELVDECKREKLEAEERGY